MKGVLSNKIFLPFDEELYFEISNKLTYKIPNSNPKYPDLILKEYSRPSKNILAIPIGRLDLVPADCTLVDKRVSASIIYPETNPAIKLRDSQQQIYNEIDDNWVINAKPGWGKSFTALFICKKLGQKALIICHTVKLRKQWEEEIYKVFGFKPSIIGSGQLQSKTPIVVSNIQTLNKHVDKFKYVFGTVIVDEVHRVPSTTFKNAVGKLAARYKIGLSGTLKRKDGKHILIQDYISNNTYIPPKENVMDPTIKLFDTGLRIPGNVMTPWAIRVNQLIATPSYPEMLKALAERQVQKGHTVLVVADRVDLIELLTAITPNSVGIVGGTKNQKELEDQIRTGKKRILYGSIAIYKEGISINQLSSLILGTPISNEPLILQLVGRIIRLLEGKVTPEVIDLVFKGKTGQRQLQTRISAYSQEGYRIEPYDIL